MKITVICEPGETGHALDQLDAAFTLDHRTVRHEVYGPDRTITTLDADPLTPQVTPEIAAHVLAHFGEGGYQAGQYCQDLILLIARSDPQRRRRLALAEPAYVLAVSMAQHTPSGVQELRAIAAGDTATVHR